MRKSLEIVANLVFWILSFWLIFQLFALRLEEVEITIEEGREIVQERIIDLSIWFYIGGIVKIACFYFIVFGISPSLFKPKKYFLFAITVLLLGSICLVFESLAIYLLEGNLPAVYFFSNLQVYGFYLASALAYGVFRQQLSREQAAQQLYSEKLQTELKLLRAQINPHFLFNTLNNLLAIAEKSEATEVANGIDELSGLLRFLIYDTQSDFISLEKELSFIKSYLALQDLRFSPEDEIKISFQHQGIEAQHLIAPSLLIPFVENACKHGLSITEPSWISIFASVNHNRLLFTVINSLHERQLTELEQQYSGVGLDNVRKRLKLRYPNTHLLSINQDSEEYNIQLEIDLS